MEKIRVKANEGTDKSQGERGGEGGEKKFSKGAGTGPLRGRKEGEPFFRGKRKGSENPDGKKKSNGCRMIGEKKTAEVRSSRQGGQDSRKRGGKGEKNDN